MTLMYIHPREVWDEDKCEKIAKRTARDGMGTKYHFKGYIGTCAGRAPYGGYGRVVYNGMIEREGELYHGEIRRLPRVAKGFKIIKRPTWGYQLVKIDAQETTQAQLAK